MKQSTWEHVPIGPRGSSKEITVYKQVHTRTLTRTYTHKHKLRIKQSAFVKWLLSTGSDLCSVGTFSSAAWGHDSS